MSTGARYRLLGLLYVSQLAPLGFFYYALTAVLRRRGVPLQQIGTLQLLAMFWVFKFVWAPLIDRYRSPRMGHYRAWLLAMQALMVAGIVLLIPLDVDADLPLVWAVVITVAFLAATQDIATDATAVRLLSPAERGMGNGIQLAGGNLGFILGGGGMLVVYDRVGWAAAVSVLALITAIPLPFLIRYREQALTGIPPGADRLSGRASLRTLVDFFRQHDAARWSLVVLPLSYAGIAIPAKLLTLILVDRGWPLDQIGMVAAVGGGIAMATAICTGALLATVQRRTALIVLGVLSLVGAAALGWGWAIGTSWYLLALVALINIAYAAMGTTIFTLCMDWSRAESAGTDYTVQSSLAVLSSDVVGAAGLSIAGVLGYRSVLAVAVVLCTAGVVVARWLPQPPMSRPVHSGGLAPALP